MDHMRISVNEPSSVILSQTNSGLRQSILKINENVTLGISISFQSKFCFHFISILHILFKDFFESIYCQYASFKSTCSKAGYVTPCKVPHEWFEFLYRVLIAYWRNYFFPNVKMLLLLSQVAIKICVLHIKIKRLKIQILKIANNVRAGGSGKFEGHYPSCAWMYTLFLL